MSPFQKQSKEIIWASNRIQNFLHRDVRKKYIAATNKTEMRLTFTNGSFIKLDGSDNYEAYRGIEPHMIVYDEFKDFRPEFHEAMDPNLGVYDAPLIAIGTPPAQDCQYTVMADEHRRDTNKYHIEAPSSDNPYISKEWLARKRQEHMDRGEWDVWQREYEGKYVKGGARKIFPMLEESMIVPHEDLKREMARDWKRYKKYWWADPAGASVFGCLFVFICPYTRRVYIMDEIYETDQKKMTVDQIGRAAMKKRDDLWIPRDPWDWTEGYDEAATWFRNEMLDRFGVNMLPTKKANKSTEKEDQLSLIKDIMLQGLLKISDRCVKTFWELDNYIKDDKGKIPKENDHNIDNLRYILKQDMYDLNVTPFETIPADDIRFTGRRISQDFPELDDFGNMNEDPMWAEGEY